MNKNKTGNTWNELFCVFPFFEGGIYALQLLLLCGTYVFSGYFCFLWLNLCISGEGLDIKRTSGCNISKFDNIGKLNG